jgi:hypothetical protein
MARKPKTEPEINEAFSLRDVATPTDLDAYKGSYRHVGVGAGIYQSKDETYGLKVVPDDPHGRTHKLKSKSGYYWEGTEQEFKDAFEKN